MKLSPHLVDLVQDALLKSFWKKKALKTFLKRPQVSEAFLAQLSNEETKREWLDHLFGKLEPSERGQALIQQMARTLSEQTAFPDLANWEDSAEKIRAAESAVVALKTYLDQKDVQQSSERDMANRRESAEETRKKTMRSISDRAALSDRLNLLGSSLGTQQGGYDFQVWFYDLMDYYEVDNRRPYTSSGRQIDGSITIDGTTYLVELKFTANQSAATDIDSLFKKVSDKSDNTMGLLISVGILLSCLARGVVVEEPSIVVRS